MGQRQSRREKVEGGVECGDGAHRRPALAPTDHTAELHPRFDETPVVVVEGGREEKGGKKTKKKRPKRRGFKSLASFFSCLSPPKSTRAQVEQGEVDQDTETPYKRSTEDQTSLQDIVCSVEDSVHQKPPISDPDVLPAAVEVVVDEVQHKDQDSPVSSSADVSESQLLKQLDCTELIKTKDDIRNKYSIGKKMGEGGCGSVYEGTRCEDGLQVAVKFTAKIENEPYINLPDLANPVPLEVALTLLANQGPSCNNIIQLLDWEDHPDRYIMVLELPSPCIDMHLFWLRHDRVFSELVARYFMRQVVDAAAVCCSRGVFHRDIKMPNLLVNTETLEVKLIDFGCGDLLRTSSYNTYSGTARYCPPEFIDIGEYHGKEATVWSLGVLLFRMITSLYPDSSDICYMDIELWSQSGYSDECCRFIRGCLKSNPEQRLHLDELLSHDWFKIPHLSR
ncbi:serine/threonine-protein kinase pim-2-like [Danio aesculapii]|uniref:serine/threonine-protein kinase pim-2-like n=1 Tax=Danio aesculapii TaxID=1142201 RepID=UPI0024BFC9B2|nr:serine/threonine-protein kinase pim-2-like [Danio aesculapii]